MKKLIEKRAVLKALLESMLATAKTEERAFTEEEDKKFSDTEAEIRALDKTIEAEERAKGIKSNVIPAVDYKPDDKIVEERAEIEERAFVDFIRARANSDSNGVENRTDNNMTFGENGAVVPKHIANKIIARVKEISPIYNMATKYNVNGNLSIPYYDESTSQITVAYVDEFVELESTSASFKSVNLTGFLAGALCKISKKLINNTNFDIIGFIIEKMAEGFAEWLEKEAFVGTENKIDGLKGVTQIITAASATNVTADELMDLQEEIPDRYQNKCIWVMSKAMRKKIRKLKDGDGNYILNRDFTEQWKYNLLGNPVYISDTMPDAAAGKTTIYYGDFSGLAVKLSEDINIDVTKEQFRTQHAVGVYGYIDVDMKVENAQKIAKLVQKSS